MNLANMVFTRMDKINGKTADCVDLSADESVIKQPQYGMPFNSYENQGLYATANKAKPAASSTLETDKVNLGGASTSLPMVTFAPNSGCNT